jgi:hypothetical protein
MAVKRCKASMSFRSFATSAALFVSVALVPAMALAHSRPAPAPSVTPSPPPPPAGITQIARREFVSWQVGSVDVARYAPQTQKGMTPQHIQQTSDQLRTFGPLEHIEWISPLTVPGGTGAKAYLYRMICGAGKVYEVLTIGADGKIDGILFRDKLPGAL